MCLMPSPCAVLALSSFQGSVTRLKLLASSQGALGLYLAFSTIEKR